MSRKVYINGAMVAKEDAVISVYDHGLLYGYGVFEGLRSYAGKVFRIEAHIEATTPGRQVSISNTA